VLFLSASSVAAQPDQRSQLTAKFRARLSEISRATDGVVGIGVIDLKSGERFGVNDTLVFPQGSAIKIPLLIEVFKQAESGTVDLAERVPVRAADQVGGTGVSRWFGDGQSMLSLRHAAVSVIRLPDNPPPNRLTAWVRRGRGGIKLRRGMCPRWERGVGKENSATPAQSAERMRRISTCELPVSRSRCEEIRRILEIPKSGEFPASVPASVRVAWKPGTVEGVETSWGLFALPANPYVLTVMVNYSDDVAATRAIRQVADATYEYFKRVARASPFGVRVPAQLADSIRRRP